MPQDEGDNEQQQGQEQTDTALGNQMELLAPSNTTINNATSPNDLMFDTQQCLGEWAIYIHGIWTDRDAAIEQAERIDLSLPSDKKIPIFVFLWEGDTNLNSFGWDES